MTSRRSDDEQHVDLYSHEYDGLKITTVFVERLALDDPALVGPMGTPTQLAMGTASYFDVSEPHTMAECPHAGPTDKEKQDDR